MFRKVRGRWIRCRVNCAFSFPALAWAMGLKLRRPSRPRRFRLAARSMLLASWLAVTLGLAKFGLPTQWATAAFFLAPLAAVVASLLARRATWRRIRQRSAGRMDWSFAATAAGVCVACFLGTLWWPQSTSVLARQVPQTPQTPSGAPSTQALFSCRVINVHDGDTLRCEDGVRVRLHAVAAREMDETCSPGHPCPDASGAAARIELTRLAANRTLACRRTGRSYNRVTAICDDDDGVEINCAMVKGGTTLLWERFYRRQPICRSGDEL